MEQLTKEKEKGNPEPVLSKEEARAQFDYWTKKLGLKHTYTFDEAWGFVEAKRKKARAKKDFRENISSLEQAMVHSGECLVGEELNAANPLKHSFAEGCYIREIYNPKNELIVTKIHKISHPFFLLKGEMSILTEKGVKRIKAPYHGITPAGTKRVIYTHEECIFVTVHVTKHKDLEQIEDEIIAKTFDEILPTQKEILELKKGGV